MPAEEGNDLKSLPAFRPDAHRRRKGPIVPDEKHSFGFFSYQFPGCNMCNVTVDEVIPRTCQRRLGDNGNICGLEDYYGDDDVEELEVEDFPNTIHVAHPCDPPRKKGAIEIELDELIGNTGDLFAAQGWDVAHLRGDRYSVNGRKVRIFLLPEGTPVPDFSHNTRRFGPAAKMAAGVMVHDGPLRQPLLDYLNQTGKNEHYDARGTENPVEVSGQAKRLEYSVPPKALGDRIQAMKEATTQAQTRRKVASKEREQICTNPILLESQLNGSIKTPALFGTRVG